MTTTETYALPVEVRHTSAPDVMAILARAEWSTLRFHFPSGDEARAQMLQELAEWSVTSADLDWDHAEHIDERGWGEH